MLKIGKLPRDDFRVGTCTRLGKIVSESARENAWVRETSDDISYIGHFVRARFEMAATMRSRSFFHIMLNRGGYAYRDDATRRDAQRRTSYSSRGYAIQRISTADV